MVETNELRETVSHRLIGKLPHVFYLLRVPILVTTVLVFVLLDFVIPGSMREALRFALIDNWYQLGIIAVALLFACAAIRFTGEVIIELVSPEMYDEGGTVSRVARLLPRVLAFLVGLAVAAPMFQIALDRGAIREFDQLLFHTVGIEGLGVPVTVAFGILYAAIGLLIAVYVKGPHTPAFAMRKPTLFVRLGFVLIFFALAGTFAAAVWGVWQPGVPYQAVEKYSTAILGLASDDTKESNALKTWTYSTSLKDQIPPSGRYFAYLKPGPVVTSDVSWQYVVAQLIALFLTCVAVRLAVAVFLDLFAPWLGGGFAPARFIRRWLPRLASTGMGAAIAAKLYYDYVVSPAPAQYLSPYPELFSVDIAHFPLTQAENVVLWAIMALYVGIGVLASVFPGSNYVGDGPWRESTSVGRRFVGAARRMAALEPFWKWFLRGFILLGIAILLFFLIIVYSNLQQVVIPQFIGPVSIILLWGATAAVLFFPLAYLANMTRIPFLMILVLAAVAFAGFNLNENHELSVVSPAHAVPDPALGEKTDIRPTFDLQQWIASRADWDQYDHYPVFLVATEGGGMRAAYFTATVLAALQDRCPAFAQHTLGISGVSGGSLGATVFAALAADYAKNDRNPKCFIDAGKQPGEIVDRARTTLSADLLSPLLGASLFPDAVQRIIPVAIPSFDRARALEHAVETSWRNSTPPQSVCQNCDPDRLEENAMYLYGWPPAFNAVPNLFLNTTEAGTGTVVPYATVSVSRLSTKFRNRAEIDDGNLDCARMDSSAIGPSDEFEEPINCVRKSASTIENEYLQGHLEKRDQLRLSTAAIVSARFPYLTPAGTVTASGRRLHLVDGGYFENSGTWLISGLLQNLMGQQFQLQSQLRSKSNPFAREKGVPQTLEEKQQDVASKARFVVIVIQSEPCTRRLPGDQCDEDEVVTSDSWNEALAPLRALLSTRGSRAVYSFNGLGALTALIQQLRSRWSPDTTDTSGQGAGSAGSSVGTGVRSDVTCDYPVCAVTLRFQNKSSSEIPLTWVLSSAARQHMDKAVDGMEKAAVRLGPPSESRTTRDDPNDIDRVLGSYRRVLCMLASRNDALSSQAEPPRKAVTSRRFAPEQRQGPASVCVPEHAAPAQAAAAP